MASANIASARDGLNVANAQRTSAESQRNLARVTLAHTGITAAVVGNVSARNAQFGEFASGGELRWTTFLDCIQHVHVKAMAPAQ